MRKALKNRQKHGMILLRDVLYLICSHEREHILAPITGGQRPKGGNIRMNKYELALVVSAKIEDDARTAVVEKAKEYITRAGGTVTEVEEAGKKRLAYEIQKMHEGFYYFIQFEADSQYRPASSDHLHDCLRGYGQGSACHQSRGYGFHSQAVGEGEIVGDPFFGHEAASFADRDKSAEGAGGSSEQCHSGRLRRGYYR